MKKKYGLFMAGVFSCLLVNGCAKSPSATSATDDAEANSNISESAMSQAGQQATASEGASSPNLMSLDYAADFQSMDYVDPADSLHPLSACTFASARTTCLNNVSTITWGGCSVGTATLSGGWTEAWTAGFCANGASPGALTNGNSVTRTSSTEVLKLASGAKVTTNTTAHSAYDGTSIPGTGVTISNTTGTRTVVINGIHKTMTGPLGRSWYDHSITSTGLTVTGTRAGGNRVVTGSLNLYHNLASYKAVHTFNSVTWGSSTCCYPTSGNISSVLTGTRSGNVTLTFSATCGQATFTDTDSTVSNISLAQCQ